MGVGLMRSNCRFCSGIFTIGKRKVLRLARIIETSYDTFACIGVDGCEYIVVPDYERGFVELYYLPDGGSEKIPGKRELPDNAGCEGEIDMRDTDDLTHWVAAMKKLMYDRM